MVCSHYMQLSTYDLRDSYRVSFTNNGRIYNLEHSEARSTFPPHWSVHPDLTTSLVSDAFFLYSLLRDRTERHVPLVLDNEGTQSARLEPALLQRTASLVGPAREGWNHICKRCCAVKEENGQYCM